MHDVDLFRKRLVSRSRGEVVDVQFDAERRRLDLRIDFREGRAVRVSGVRRAGCEVHDTEEKTWRHLDFFQHQAYLTARVPRVICPEHGVLQVKVPWARERSGFTLLFEALVMALVKEMPVAALGGLVGETDMRIWRIVHHYVDRAVEAQDLSGLERAGIDETSEPARAGLRVGVRRSGRAPCCVRDRGSRSGHGAGVFLLSGDPWRRGGARQGGLPGHVGGLPGGVAEVSALSGDHV